MPRLYTPSLNVLAPGRHRWPLRPASATSILAISALSVGVIVQPAKVADDKLGQPPICSATTAGQSNGICTVKDLGHGEHRLEISLKAASATVDIGGYKVVTENYNGNYLTPVVEALPGDTVAAHLVDALPPASPAPGHAGMQWGSDR